MASASDSPVQQLILLTAQGLLTHMAAWHLCGTETFLDAWNKWGELLHSISFHNDEIIFKRSLKKYLSKQKLRHQSIYCRNNFL